MYFRRGTCTRQAHVDIPDGTVEEEIGRNGFFGRVSHLYRANPPVGWTAIEGDCRPHALETAKLQARTGDYIGRRAPLLRNDDAVISMGEIVGPATSTFRNADGDEVHFIHRGCGHLDSDFGSLRYEAGDYLVIPRGTGYRLSAAEPTQELVIQTREEVGIPDRGILGKHALFDTDAIEAPTPDSSRRLEGEHTIVIQRGGKLTRVTYPFDPLDVVGWKGDLTIWRLNIRDIRPIMSERYHLPPTAHVTFATPSVVICSFLPRGLEVGDPGALKVPFYHSNVDYDEVLFYHDGDFFSREGISAGMLTFHPQGIHHGPHPGAIEAAKTKTRTDEKAVMIDTRRPLEVTADGLAISRPDYWKSWQPKR
ncbi:MAG: homogentisate 1,2-dioxygenase [Myxococcales bacterium]|nr:homogentisate 1,2-dioxygenase [Myxococcales bacterium]MCB9532503.1 homogentisate 1,2-dioxygenase [Myxococcales bacterium]MCB9533133.1 homogentisate 1,2-dioxygenase [Myxococcales bacterium]